MCYLEDFCDIHHQKHAQGTLHSCFVSITVQLLLHLLHQMTSVEYLKFTSICFPRLATFFTFTNILQLYLTSLSTVVYHFLVHLTCHFACCAVTADDFTLTFTLASSDDVFHDASRHCKRRPLANRRNTLLALLLCSTKSYICLLTAGCTATLNRRHLRARCRTPV
jgi:hypothetical protein